MVSNLRIPGVASVELSLSDDFVTENVYVDSSRDVLSFRLFKTGSDGTGTFSLKYSIDGSSYESVTDDSSAAVELALDEMGVSADGFDDARPRIGFYRWEYSVGTNTTGTVQIKMEV